MIAKIAAARARHHWRPTRAAFFDVLSTSSVCMTHLRIRRSRSSRNPLEVVLWSRRGGQALIGHPQTLIVAGMTRMDLSSPRWRSGRPRVETRNAAGCVRIPVKFDIAEGEAADVARVGRNGIRNGCCARSGVRGRGRWRNLSRCHRHDQGSSQTCGEQKRDRDPAPTDLLVSECGLHQCLHGVEWPEGCGRS